ncbi:MAG: hypothetical protein EA425_17130 [Puniceicoccaceae bacterium]|nr:MAG: hypothetical protein EA425_17130 [Puniceicoccaceae bacterium]
MASPDPLETAGAVWIRDDAPERNQFVCFERCFTLVEQPAGALLHLFADTRYRLQVNGRFVASGPGRFVTSHPEYDTHELAPLLVAGENRIQVVVNFFGAASYQSMPDGRPGFWAAGGCGAVSFATPGEWTARRPGAWRWDAPLFSFAQSPVEICDTRLLEAGEPVAPAVCHGADAPWGPLQPYSGAPAPFAEIQPRRIELAGLLSDGERRHGFMSHNALALRQIGQPRRAPWTAFATWIRSPREQTVKISCFWSDLLLNGRPVAVDKRSDLGNHATALLDLAAGWNLLVGEVEVLAEFWAYCLGIPQDAEVGLHACQDSAEPRPLAVAPPMERSALQLPRPGDTEPPAGWMRHDGDPSALTPARMMGWDRPVPEVVRGLAMERWSEIAAFTGRAATWCLSFSGDFLGHVVAEVEAPAGSVLDVACDDWIREDGAAGLYRSNPFTDAADRFILRGGRQVVETFHPRGGKFLQVTLRAPDGGDAGRLVLHRVWVRSRQTLEADESAFACDLSELEWAWPTAIRTLQSCTEEAYTDTPWRERASYIGDSLVNFHLQALFSRDLRTPRRVLRSFAQSQLPDGQLPCCTPSWLRRPHEDYTLLWIQWLRDFWAQTGDRGLVEEMWPAVERIWASPTWDRHHSGLWNADGKRLFIDWGCARSDREGEANGVLNFLRLLAARASAELAEVLGKTGWAARMIEDSEAVEAALFTELWDDGRRRFRAALGADGPALHANILALAVGAGSVEQRRQVLATIEPALRDNLRNGLENGRGGSHAELYFLYFLLPALAELDRPDLAEFLIREHYGYLRSWGDDTLAECFYQRAAGTGSRCHSWSGGAAVYAARYVLGLRPAVPGSLEAWIFQPVVAGIRQASGRIAHPLGWLEVSWRRQDEAIVATLNAPDGVRIVRPDAQPVAASPRSPEATAALREQAGGG